MKNKSIKKNAVLNTIKSLLAVIFPLISFPYVSSVLGVESLGKYNFSLSVVSYFLLIAGLGISTYAIREGSAIRYEQEKINRFSSQMITINVITTVLTYLMFFVSILFVPKFQNYTLLLLIFSVEIIFTTIGAEWIFIIFEEYSYITIRRISVQVISLVLLFLLVKKPEDVWIYALITVIANAGANIFNLFRMKKYVKIRPTLKLNLRKHIVPILIIFASSVAIKVYTSSDTIMLGFLKGDIEVGIYSVAVKIYNVIKPLLTAILTVAIPRLGFLYGNNKYIEYKELLNKIYQCLLIIVLPAVSGLFLLSKEAILLISNVNYIGASSSLKILSVAIVFSTLSCFFNQCVLIPQKKEKVFLIATVVSAIANIILNYVLIIFLNNVGAAIATLIAEFISMVICWVGSRKQLDVKANLINLISVFFGCVAIAAVCICFNYVISSNTVLRVLMSVMCSVVIYAIILLLFRNKVVMSIIHSIFLKFKRS